MSNSRPACKQNQYLFLITATLLEDNHLLRTNTLWSNMLILHNIQEGSSSMTYVSIQLCGLRKCRYVYTENIYNNDIHMYICRYLTLLVYSSLPLNSIISGAMYPGVPQFPLDVLSDTNNKTCHIPLMLCQKEGLTKCQLNTS